MSDNKFFLQLKGTQTPKSVVEIKNDKLVTPFTGVPHSTDVVGSIIDDKDSSVVVAKGAQNWKLDGSSLVVASSLSGDGSDYTGEFNVSGNGLWINAAYSLPATIFSAGTKWALKLCGKNLLTTSGQTIGFTLIVKIGNTHITSKTFTVVEGANVFCRQLVIDFSESEQTVIKAQNGDSLTVQLLCSDANASATIYNGMTVFTALQRRVDGDAVASDLYTFEDLGIDLANHIANKNNPHEVTKAQVGLGNCDNTSDLDKPVSTATQAALDNKVSKSGDTMTGILKMRATSSFQCAIAPFWDGVGFYKLNSDDSVTLIASIEDPDGFVPWVTNTYNIGSSLKKWKNLYLGGKLFVSKINNGYDLDVPAKSGTLATMGDVELAARSGRMLTDQGVWYAKMYAATVAPAAENGTNYADFSQVDEKGNPIIVTYNRVNGAWVEDQTITPPTEYDGYITVTSKIWDIAEQAGQQGGRVLWSHTSREFTPYPLIVSFEDINVTGDSTVIMPQNPSSSQIVNKGYVDNAIANSGTGRNVGDIFLTTRNDNELNGAVECDGSSYNTTDFTGAQSIGQLLSAGKVPYVSLSAYATLLAQDGSVGVFGWDGVGTTAFRVPSLNDVFIETGTAAEIGDYIAPGLPNITGSIGPAESQNGVSGAFKTGSNVSGKFHRANTGSTEKAIDFDASLSNSIYGNSNTVQPNTVRYRAMVQLAVSATDEALETCTSVLADVAGLKSHEVIAFQAPTAQNNYTWYRKYADGWVEQGGVASNSSTTTTWAVAVVFPVEMSDTNYSYQVTPKLESFNTNGGAMGAIYQNTTTGFTLEVTSKYSNTGNTQQAAWRVEGMAA